MTAFRARVFASLLVVCASAARAELPKWSYEINADYSLGGGARTKFSDGESGDVSEQSGSAKFVLSPQITEKLLLRFGVDWQRFSFDRPHASGLPQTLQSTSVLVGADLQLFDAVLVRVEAEPGFYNDSRDLTTRGFNVPFVIGGTYLISADLQWILGVSVDFNRAYPVLPGIGLRWKFAESWTLNAILPNPRLEFQLGRKTTLYAGAQLIESTYRVSNDFGGRSGDARLNDAIIDYNEIRAGLGAQWKLSRALTLEFEAGYMPYREFDFHRADVTVETKSGAAYGQLNFSSSF
ncbi:MAG: DUF6268 family outer membrane beta-barrel protein [Verrucomicrobiota bacterium]|nr:DUF6268 family outer membrane beta-barrel protein [Verrucomicrobiota bacterium]